MPSPCVDSSKPARHSHGGWQRGFPCAALVALVGTIGFASSFENAMDLWMFMHVRCLASLWFYFHDVPDAYVVKDCDELGTVFESRVPVLFKRCIPAELTSLDFAFLPNTTQNFYPLCDSKLTRFTASFEALDGSRTPLVEVIPCQGGTLAQKMDRFWRPVQKQRNPYVATHLYIMDEAELDHVTRGLALGGVVPQGFKFRSSLAWMITLFSQGFSNVRFLHSHPDRVFSFGMGTREWDVINPKHHDKFEFGWGFNNIIVPSRESVEAPRVRIVKERGDIFVLPPWWIHKTTPMNSSKERGINFNIQMFAEGQIIGEAARLIRRLGLWRLLHSHQS